MILKICTTCLGNRAFMASYDVENIANCPADGCCEHCKNSTHSHALRWISAARIATGDIACFPPKCVSNAIATQRRVAVLSSEPALVVGNAVTDELSFFFGPGKSLPLPTSN